MPKARLVYESLPYFEIGREFDVNLSIGIQALIGNLSFEKMMLISWTSPCS